VRACAHRNTLLESAASGLHLPSSVRRTGLRAGTEPPAGQTARSNAHLTSSTIAQRHKDALEGLDFSAHTWTIASSTLPLPATTARGQYFEQFWLPRARTDLHDDASSLRRSTPRCRRSGRRLGRTSATSLRARKRLRTPFTLRAKCGPLDQLRDGPNRRTHDVAHEAGRAMALCQTDRTPSPHDSGPTRLLARGVVLHPWWSRFAWTRRLPR
jgi:hypothetical protein